MIRRISLALLELEGIPLVKQHVIIQPINDRETDPQLSASARTDVKASNGIWVTVWLQWLPDVARREKMKAKGRLVDGNNRNYLIVASTNVNVDSRLLNKRWGTLSTEREPPVDNDGFAFKAIPHR